MFSHVFLAMTTTEFAEFQPPKTAYMACHFSPYGKGLTNLPRDLPKGSILLLDDSTPPCGHDAKITAEQLCQLTEQFSPVAILLDFQGERTTESTAMAEHLVHTLPCPVAVTEQYAKALGCSVFLSPLPANKALGEYLAPWNKQGVYLEIAPAAVQVTVTRSGSSAIPIPFAKGLPLSDKRLLCHYRTESFPERAVFTLSRTKEDLAALVQQAKDMAVLGCIGLYQELKRL